MFRSTPKILSSVARSTRRSFSTGGFFEQVTPTFYRHVPSQHQGDAPLALFDFDWTLCATRSGRTLPLFEKDVRLIYPADVYQEKIPWNTHRVVIVTNQTRLHKEFETRVSWFLEEIGKDCEVWMSTDFDEYRIPATGMWDHVVGKNASPQNSFYVGKRGGRQRDISCADRVFSWNTGINFYTPEEYFVDTSREDYAYNGLVPEYLRDAYQPLEGKWDSMDWVRDKQELVLFVGPYTSGKTFISNRYFMDKPNYEVLDVAHLTKNQQKDAVSNVLREKKSAVLDVALPTLADRKRFIRCANSLDPNISVRCIYVNDVDDKLAFHLDMYREKTQRVKHATAQSQRSYSKKYVPPSSDEGFNEISEVNFAPVFDDPEHKRLFYQAVSA